MSDYTNIAMNHFEHVIPEDVTLLKKKLKTQQSVFSDVIKLQPNPEIKNTARLVHNEVSKLRRKTSDRNAVLELMQVSIESMKLVNDPSQAKNLIGYTKLTQDIKQKQSRAWKILAGAMIALAMSVSIR